ncbi:MAG: hypothetical protein J2P35_12800, partial [Actinobacteria bacterium]|nr:hypothetical protein [Actinomycetota bacterium]
MHNRCGIPVVSTVAAMDSPQSSAGRLVDPAQQAGAGLRVTGGPKAAIHRTVPGQARAQPARQLAAQQPLGLLTGIGYLGGHGGDVTR